MVCFGCLRPGGCGGLQRTLAGGVADACLQGLGLFGVTSEADLEKFVDFEDFFWIKRFQSDEKDKTGY